MKLFLNKLALSTFYLVAQKKGYSFSQVRSPYDYKQAEDFYDTEGLSFPASLSVKVHNYKAGSIYFIAYQHSKPVGVVRLGNPKVVNRPYELYGVDKEGVHHEIQSLIVNKEQNNEAQFVMLGLLREMYIYSLKNNIKSWSCCSPRSMYLTMSRYSDTIETTEIDFSKIDTPLTQFLYNNKIIETYFTLDVSSFSPWVILIKFIKRSIKKWELPNSLKFLPKTYGIDKLNFSITKN